MIPDWNFAGVVPAVRPGETGVSLDRSPYNVSMLAFAEKYCLTDARANILRGLLEYRSELYGIGIVDGFQWLNGSFCEHVEVNEGRSPRDIDVVSFVRFADGFDPSVVATRPDLFDKSAAKDKYQVDAHFMQLGRQLAEFDTKYISYWYSMWSHTRAGIWKGFFQVALDPAEDGEAIGLIDAFLADGGKNVE